MASLGLAPEGQHCLMLQVWACVVNQAPPWCVLCDIPVVEADGSAAVDDLLKVLAKYDARSNPEAKSPAFQSGLITVYGSTCRQSLFALLSSLISGKAIWCIDLWPGHSASLTCVLCVTYGIGSAPYPLPFEGTMSIVVHSLSFLLNDHAECFLLWFG